MREPGIQPYAERDASGGPALDASGARPSPPSYRLRRRDVRRMMFSTRPSDRSLARALTLPPSSPPPPLRTRRREIALALPASFHVGDDPSGFPGTLHVTTRRLVWIGAGPGAGRAYEVPFPSLTMHAVARDEAKPCIYAQVEGPPPPDLPADHPSAAAAADERTASEEEDGFDEMTEVRFAPDDADALDDLFKALCDGAAANPDGADAFEDEDEDGGGFFYDEAEVAAGAGADARLAALAGFDAMLAVEETIAEDPGRFED